MKTSTSIALLLGGFAACFALPAAVSGAPASSAATSASSQPGSVIEGRVFNPLTGEYLSNAEVRVQGTENSVLTQNDGRYRLVNVPTGSAVTLVVTYTGYHPATHSLTVPSGVSSHDFDLTPSLAGRRDAGVVALDKFTVSGSREGSAKAIMEQRNALTVKNVVATDTFGALLQGNVGN